MRDFHLKSPALAPSILSADFGRLAEEIRAVDEAGPPVVSAIRKATKLPLDAHLMIENADRWVEKFIDAGADMVSVHVEACPHLHRTLGVIKARGARAGIVLNPATPLATTDSILNEVDYVLLMSVNPGFGGQKFIPSVRRKIAILQERIVARDLRVQIEVDGGVDAENIADLVKDGADVFVAGSAVFASGDPASAVRKLKTLAEGARR